MKGAYVLIMRSKGVELNVGKLGKVSVPRGLIAYVGSAKGPAGLGARLSRHFRRGKMRRWHIDYLTESEGVEVIGALALVGGEESKVASILMDECVPLAAGFGCSDKKRDFTHLFLVKDLSSLRNKLSKLGKVIELQLGARET